MKVTKRQLRRIIKEEKARLKEQGALPMQGSKDAARGARNAYHQLLTLLDQAAAKAAEMKQLNTVANDANDPVHDFTWEGNESLEVVNRLEIIYEEAGFGDDGSSLKEYL